MNTKKWLIDVNALPESATAISTDGRLFIAWSEIVKAPIVDAVEVVHGRWEKYHTYNEKEAYRCSACYQHWRPGFFPHLYCPNCGAKMDFEGET